MRQFDVTQIPSANNNIHIYLGAAKQVCYVSAAEFKSGYLIYSNNRSVW